MNFEKLLGFRTNLSLIAIRFNHLHVCPSVPSFQVKSNGSVPQNVCSCGKFLLAGRCGRNNMSLEGKCCWEKDNSCVLCPKTSPNPLPPLKVLFYAIFYATPKLASNVWTYPSSGKLPSKSGCRL